VTSKPAILPFAAVVAWCLAAAFPLSAEGQLVWLGTYTRGKSDSEGIYLSRLDPASGELSPPRLAARAENPGFLARHPSRPLLYAVSEVSDAGGGRQGVVAAFAIRPDGSLEALGSQPSGGGGPCHLDVDPGGRCVAAANYGGGSSVALGIAENGSLRPAVDGGAGGRGLLVHPPRHESPAGIVPRRQEAPHAHCATIAADGRFVLVADLGLDRVFAHRLDAAAATLELAASKELAAGSGPRHVAFSRDGRRLYVVNELNLTVTGCNYDPASGRLEAFQTISTLPDGLGDALGLSTAEIAVHPSGRFLYASNRGHDSLACFAIDAESGRLDRLEVAALGVKTPRSFAIAPGGRWLLAAGQNSDNVAIFRIDAGGRIKATGRSIKVPRPVCVCFDLPAP